MPDETEPSILEYARYYGLCRDHLDINPLDLVPSPDDFSVEPDAGLQWLALDFGITIPPSEKLVAVKEASTLLAATNPKQYEGCDSEGFDPLPTHRIRNLKLELPLLRSDHEVDMLNLVRRIEPNLAEEFIPFETVDDELDEGIGWPSSCHELPDMFFQKAQNEKLEVPKEVVAYMKAALDNRIQGKEPIFDYEWPTPQKVRSLLFSTSGLKAKSTTVSSSRACHASLTATFTLSTALRTVFGDRPSRPPV